MNSTEIKTLIEAKLDGAQVTVNSNDNVHFECEVVYPPFAKLKRIEHHQMVNAILADYIQSGEIHAISIKTRS